MSFSWLRSRPELSGSEEGEREREAKSDSTLRSVGELRSLLFFALLAKSETSEAHMSAGSGGE